MTMTAEAAAITDNADPGAATTVRVGEYYWKQDGPANWVLGVVTAMDDVGSSVRFHLVDETSGEMLPESEAPPLALALDEIPLFPANPMHSTAADMTSLHHLHEAALAKNLEDRASLKNQRPYTFMANVLIAVNPLRYLEDPDKSLYVTQSLDRCPPHPYYVAENAYRQLSTVRAVMQNQSIIISGESGSGKTETSKIILDFLTTRAQGNERLSSNFSEDDFEPEMTPNILPMPASSTAALSYPLSARPIEHGKLSPVALGERLMETIPILESFGNAKTHRNHNSSRFGKYMRLQFSTHSQHLTGASIDTYLLEKSRLVSQPIGERNFHIFYELLHSKDTQYLTDTLHLVPQRPEEYSFLNQSGCLRSELIDDTNNFQKLCRALDFINIDETARDEVFRVVAGLLHLGNITISEEDTSEGPTACIAKDDAKAWEALDHAAELLGVAKEELDECIMKKRIMARGSRRNSVYYSKRDTKNAVYSRDTIAKTIYEHAFNWLMIQCASALDYDSARSDVIPYIGVLDIFGFEDFEPKNRNSLEQLLINYANEALQSLFNACIFEAEQELYRSENIYNPVNHSVTFPFRIPGVEREVPDTSDFNIHAQTTAPKGEMVQYTDNRECLNLIASRQGGIFVTIDNVARMPGPSDRKLNERLHTLFKKHPCFPAPHPKDARDTFIIRHYAGTVSYTISSFIDKNNNIVSDQFEELIKHSTSRILKDIMARAEVSNASSGSKNKSIGAFGPSKRAKGGSVSSLFSTQMKGLITELEGTACNFVRCIKPNTQMKVGLFDKPFVVEQLRCSGTVQACEVLRVGLPTRILYAEVIDVYKNVLQPEVFMKFDYDDKLFTQAVLWAYGFPTSAYRLGNSRLFFRTGKIDLLDKLLEPKVDATKLTKDVLLYLRKKRWVSVATKVIVCNLFVQIYEKCKYRRKAIVIQCMVRQRLARNRVRRIRTHHRISALWNRLTDRARIIKAYEDLPEDKMVLLNKLLAKNYLPPGQRWLLKWLGPLARVIYMQKLWKKMTTQYLAKRAFISLYETVRRRRSAVRMQAMARCLLAKKVFRRLKTKRLARQHWKTAILKARVFCLFRRELHNIHVNRLESVNNGLKTSLHETQERLCFVEEEAQRLRDENSRLLAALERKNAQVYEQTKRVGALETVLKSTQKELVDTQKRASSGFLERVIRFFTCSMVQAPMAPQTHVRKQDEIIVEVEDKQFADSETIPLCKQATKLKPLGVSTHKIMANPADDEEELEVEELRARESDVLFSVSRFCF